MLLSEHVDQYRRKVDSKYSIPSDIQRIVLDWSTVKTILATITEDNAHIIPMHPPFPGGYIEWWEDLSDASRSDVPGVWVDPGVCGFVAEFEHMNIKDFEHRHDKKFHDGIKDANQSSGVILCRSFFVIKKANMKVIDVGITTVQPFTHPHCVGPREITPAYYERAFFRTWGPRSEQASEYGKSIHVDITATVFSLFAALNSKIVSTKEVEPTKDQKKKAKRARRAKPSPYRVIRLTTQGRKLHNAATAEPGATRGKCAAHMVRFHPRVLNHEKYSRDENGLPRVTWIPAHVRGGEEGDKLENKPIKVTA